MANSAATTTIGIPGEPQLAGVSCPVCGSTRIADYGPPAHRRPPEVAGVPIELSDLSLRHQRCRDCEFQFVYPSIPPQRLIDCYRRSVAHWGTAGETIWRRFYERKKQLLEKFSPGRSILDFGCYDGGFLDYLGAGWEKAGIEPSSEAARVAESRNICIVAPTLDAVDLTKHGSSFCAVTIFDVMEHLPDPVHDLSQLGQMLVPGGIILMETANTDSSDWMRFGNRHPYCGIVEHVSFFNRKSIEVAGQRAGLSLIHFERSPHHQPFPTRKDYWPWFVPYKILRGLTWIKFPLPRRLRDIAAGPVPRAIEPEDHFMAVLRRDA